MDAFIHRFIQGCAAAAAAPDAGVATPAPDAPDDGVVVTAAADSETSQATVPPPPTIPASDVKKGKRKANRKRKAKMPVENDNPRKVPKLKTDTSASDSVGLPAPAVQRNTSSINLDVPNYQGLDIAWNLNANGTVSAVTFLFGGSTS
ncbi:hypothetical protein FN846DRAFT_909599 [Sphaerosporella brunnea]|uniref:Uncharacterized protein n=1 Tax=Sphaerosporella brunnea TaxID=1250544 RepID=A0A5J5EP71_9PEZI|nr:hypothetical protein FN846DRAFT_909599 [Sphaerosporella brunnea]